MSDDREQRLVDAVYGEGAAAPGDEAEAARLKAFRDGLARRLAVEPPPSDLRARLVAEARARVRARRPAWLTWGLRLAPVATVVLIVGVWITVQPRFDREEVAAPERTVAQAAAEWATRAPVVPAVPPAGARGEAKPVAAAPAPDAQRPAAGQPAPAVAAAPAGEPSVTKLAEADGDKGGVPAKDQAVAKKAAAVDDSRQRLLRELEKRPVSSGRLSAGKGSGLLGDRDGVAEALSNALAAGRLMGGEESNGLKGDSVGGGGYGGLAAVRSGEGATATAEGFGTLGAASGAARAGGSGYGRTGGSLSQPASAAPSAPAPTKARKADEARARQAVRELEEAGEPDEITWADDGAVADVPAPSERTKAEARADADDARAQTASAPTDATPPSAAVTLPSVASAAAPAEPAAKGDAKPVARPAAPAVGPAAACAALELAYTRATTSAARVDAALRLVACRRQVGATGLAKKLLEELTNDTTLTPADRARVVEALKTL